MISKTVTHLPNHRLSRDVFRSLSVGLGDADTMHELRFAERSWRMVVMSVLLDAFDRRGNITGELVPAAEAWRLLAAADLADRAATDAVLAQPQVGIWAAHILRRLDTPVDGAIPLWVEAGYLHALAAAAGVRARLSFELRIPVQRGVLVLPTVGSALVPGAPPWSTAVVTCVDGAFEVTTAEGTSVGPGTPAWREPVMVTVASAGIELTVELMDRDHYRDLRGPSEPHTLSAEEIARWERQLAEAWEILVREQAERAPAIAAILRVLTPLPRRERFRYLSASGGEAFGSILLSELDDASELAVTLVHETQHQKLGSLLHLLTLSDEDPGRRYYAPWRDDPRPVGGLLQGVYAFAGIIEFWARHRSPRYADLARFELTLWRTQTVGVLRTLAASGRLTALGEQFLALLSDDVMARLGPDRPVAHIDDMAGLAALDHRAMWRGHHLVVDAADAEVLAEAWRRGGAAVPPVRPVLVRTSGSREVGLFDSRAVLMRHRLGDPALLARMRDDPGLLSATVTGAHPADVELVTGERRTAETAYAGMVSADPGNVHGWVGLGLARSDRPDDAAARALLGRPELVRAIACRLTTSRVPGEAPPDPVRLAAWLEAGVPAGTFDMPVPAAWPTA